MRIVPTACVLVAMLLPTTGATSQQDSDKTQGKRQTYSIDWWSVNGGLGEIGAGDYRLQAVVGQPNTTASSGGDFALIGGFLPGADPGFVFADGFEGGSTSRWTTAVGD